MQILELCIRYTSELKNDVISWTIYMIGRIPTVTQHGQNNYLMKQTTKANGKPTRFFAIQ